MISRVVPRRWRNHQVADKRTVLVPNQWNGSVQQYYHFLLGYLAPIMAWRRSNRGKPIAVRDCGPMNRWFDLLEPETDLNIMTVGDVLHVLAGNLQPNKVLRGMDFPEHFSEKGIREFAEATLDIASRRMSTPASTYRVLVTDRLSSDDFFVTPAAEWPEAGIQKRSVPNLKSITASWSNSEMLHFDGAQTDICQQIALHSAARVLIGQHGAGLTNMIWMPPGSVVIEILPPMPAEAQDIFKRLARTLRLRHVTVHQESVHATVEPHELTSAYRRAIAEDTV